MKRNTMPMLVLAAALLWPAACTVEQTEEGELPDVEVEGGKLPEYDVDPAKVKVGTDTKTIKVPTIDITKDTTRHN